MAEVAGFVASIFGILELTEKVVATTFWYVGVLRSAKSEVNYLAEELCALYRVLAILQGSLEVDSGADGAQPLAEYVLEEFRGELEAAYLKMDEKRRKNGVERLKWPLQERETSVLMNRVERVKSLCLLAVQADQISLIKAIKEYALNTDLAVQCLEVEADAQRQWRENEKYDKILEWLFSGEFSRKHSDIKQKRTEGTGGWLLESVEFQQWRHGRSHPILWGRGIPGAGKTFLASTVIDDLLDTSVGQNGVAYIYFDYKEQDRQRPHAVLSCILKQLIHQMPEFPVHIEETYDSLGRKGKRPNVHELYSTMQLVSRAFVRTYIICDALDECHPEYQREELLPLFRRMAEEAGFRLFVTSRPHPEDIGDSFRDVPKIEIFAREEDLRSFVQSKIYNNRRARSLIGGCKYGEQIVSELVVSARGMFLIAQFHTEHLCQLTTVKQIRRELEKLRTDAHEEHPLDPTYDRAIDIMLGKNRYEVELALKILTWLTKAGRTLLVDELRIAVSIEPGKHEIDYEEELPKPSTLTDVCAGLVEIDENCGSIRLVHYTVQEYLVRKSVVPSDENPAFNVLLSCLTYLSFDAFQVGCWDFRISRPQLRQIKAHPFLEYAAQNLSYHIQQTQHPERSMEAFLHFIERPYNVATYFQAATFRHREGFMFRNLEQHPLCVTAAIGHEPALRHLITQISYPPDHRDHNGRTPLSWAARFGHQAIVEWLTSRMDVDVNSADNYSKTPLAQAAHGGNETIVKVLLSRGADVNAMDRDDWTPLLWAAQWGHEGVLKILIEHGAEIEVEDKAGWGPLSWAAQGGHSAVIELLMEKGAKAGRVEFPAAKPLMDWAVRKGRTDVSEVLWKKWKSIEERSIFSAL